MKYKQTKRLAMAVAAAGAAAYSVVAGKGVFNKPRFKEQHEALSKYIDTNYPDCSYSPIVIHGKGWSSTIKKRGRVVAFVYFTKSKDGVYIFTESTEKRK